MFFTLAKVQFITKELSATKIQFYAFRMERSRSQAVEVGEGGGIGKLEESTELKQIYGQSQSERDFFV